MKGNQGSAVAVGTWSLRKHFDVTECQVHRFGYIYQVDGSFLVAFFFRQGQAFQRDVGLGFGGNRPGTPDATDGGSVACDPDGFCQYQRFRQGVGCVGQAQGTDFFEG